MNAFIRVAVRLVYYLAYDMHFEGLENLPDKDHEGVIVASNHRSYADPVLLTMYMKRPMHYMAKEELFNNKLFGAFITGLGAFPVKRGAGDMQVINKSVELLEKGHNVVIFPEGTRSKENKVLRGKTGVALIAAMSGADVLPVGICFEGTKLHFRTKLTIRYGKIIPHEEIAVSEERNPRELRRAKERIMSAIKVLVEGEAPEDSSETGEET